MDHEDQPITIKHACRIVGGESNPISPPTYYRGVKAGIFPAPFHPSPGISRVWRNKLLAALQAREVA